MIICSSEDPDLIHSYIIFEPDEDLPIIHYIFTKFSYRRLGFAKLLLKSVIKEDDLVLYTHKTRSSEKMIHHYPKAIYDPYQLFTETLWRSS